MFCGKCGFRCDDDAVFCTNCGAKVGGVQQAGNTQSVGSAQPVGNAQPVDSARPARRNRDNGKEGGRNRNEGGSNRNRRVGIAAVAIAAVCFIVAAIKIVTMFGGGGYEEPIDRFFAILTGSEKIDTFTELVPKKLIKNRLKEDGYSMEEFTDELTDNIRPLVKQIKDYKVSYEIVSAEKVTGAELDSLKEEYKYQGVEISAAKDVKVSVKVEYRGDTEKDTQEVRVIKVNHSWYLDVFQFGGL